MDKIIVTTTQELEELIERNFQKYFHIASINQPTSTNRFLSIDETISYLNIPKGTLYQLTHRRELPFTKVGRSLRFLKVDLDNWLFSNRKASRKEILTNIKSPKV